MERLSEIVVAKVVKGLTGQVMGPEREQIDYEVFPVVLPMRLPSGATDSVIGMVVCLFTPSPDPEDRIVKQEVLENPYARQEEVDRLVMRVVESIREEYDLIRRMREGGITNG